MRDSGKLIGFVISILLIFVDGPSAQIIQRENAVATSSRKGEVWGYDPAKGTEKNDILKNFNLHRGRWWNYYERGSWYLAYGHYRAAEDDFRVVVKKRPKDKRNGRTYGMHFRDCFAHRELGITLYYQAIQKEKESESDMLSLLKESIKELNQSLNQSESSRAMFFLNLAWEANKEDIEDTSAPVIKVENATRTGENWALVFCNQHTVQLDIRVTDDMSGVGPVWVNGERLLVEHWDPIIPQTVHVPVDPNKSWITVRARDLAGKSSPTILVRVELDMRPPTIFATARPEQMTADGIVPVEFSARDDRGLSTIQLGDQEISSNGRLEHNIVTYVRTEPGEAPLEVRATDQAGNTTKGFVALLPEDNKTKGRVDAAWPLEKPVYFKQRLTTHERMQAIQFAAMEDTYEPVAAQVMWDNRNLYARSLLASASSIAEVSGADGTCVPDFVFKKSDYMPGIPDGYPVSGHQYVVQGTLQSATHIKKIEIDRKTIPVGPYDGSVVFSEPVQLLEDETREIQVKAICVNDSVAEYRPPLKVRRVPDPTVAPECVYSVVVLPPQQAGTPYDQGVEHRAIELTYSDIQSVVMDCNLYDQNNDKDIPRFDCRTLRSLDAGRINKMLNELGLGKSDEEDEKYKVRRLGEKLGVDLGIYCDIEDYEKQIQIRLWVYDIKDRCLVLDYPIETYIQKGKSEEALNRLKWELANAIPRIKGEVEKKSNFFKTIDLDCGEDNRLFRGAKLWVFRKKEMADNIQPERLVQAHVKSLKKRSSKAKIVDSDNEENPILKVQPGKVFFITK